MQAVVGLQNRQSQLVPSLFDPWTSNIQTKEQTVCICIAVFTKIKKALTFLFLIGATMGEVSVCAFSVSGAICW